jgi:hypothetical protein
MVPDWVLEQLDRVTRTSARELDRWRKREETMRLLRWGTEIAMDDDPRRSTAGLDVLDALLGSPLLAAEDKVLVGAITRAVAVLSGTLDEHGGRPP